MFQLDILNLCMDSFKWTKLKMHEQNMNLNFNSAVHFVSQSSINIILENRYRYTWNTPSNTNVVYKHKQFKKTSLYNQFFASFRIHIKLTSWYFKLTFWDLDLNL